MAGAKMVDKTNMSLDDIIKMDRKNTKVKPNFIKNKNYLARNVVKKARNSFKHRKNISFPQRNMNISEKRQDVRNRLIRTKQMNNSNKTISRNMQKSTRNSNAPRQNRFLNTNSRPRINNRINANVINSAPAFRITTNNERYQSNNRGRPNTRPTYKRFSNVNNNTNSFENNNRNQSMNFSGNYRRPIDRIDPYQFSRRNNSGHINRNSILARDREYEAMARALIEAHKESRYSFTQSASQRRYNGPFESRGYPYRR